MLSVAWLKSEASYVGAAANDDYVEPDDELEDLRKVPHFDGESYLRTYYIATVMIREDNPNQKHLVAYVVASGEYDGESLR